MSRQNVDRSVDKFVYIVYFILYYIEACEDRALGA